MKAPKFLLVYHTEQYPYTRIEHLTLEEIAIKTNDMPRGNFVIIEGRMVKGFDQDWPYYE